MGRHGKAPPFTGATLEQLDALEHLIAKRFLEANGGKRFNGFYQSVPPCFGEGRRSLVVHYYWYTDKEPPWPENMPQSFQGYPVLYEEMD